MLTWIQITSGRGPEECCWVVANIVKQISKEGNEHNLKTTVIHSVPGIKPHTLKSALMAIEGDGAKMTKFVHSWEGTIQWIGQSPFRSFQKRKNWFVGVSIENPVKNQQLKKWNQNEIKIETMKASGPGGQHVNKTDSAVRATYIPLKLSCIAKEERSQSLNKKLALSRLICLLEEQEEKKLEHKQQIRWHKHNLLERGNPVRIFKGADFKFVNRRL